MAEPGERIEIVRLANGWRIDNWAEHSGVRKCCGRVHYADETMARKFAEMLQKATGLPIVEAGQ